MRKSFIFIILLLLFSLFPAVANDNVFSIQKWDFFWNKFISSNSQEIPDMEIILPSNWRKATKEITGKNQNEGFCSYRTEISNLNPEKKYAILVNKSPFSACTLYVNGENLFEVGEVSTSKKNHKSSLSPIYVFFSPNEFGKAEIIFHVSNYKQHSTGFSSSIYFGLKSDIYKYFILQNGISWLALGTLIILACFNILIFFLSSQKKENLYFSILAIVLAAKIGASGFSIFAITLNLPYQLLVKIDYLAICIIPLLLTLITIKNSKTYVKTKLITKIVLISSAITSLLTILLPISILSFYVPLFEVIAFIIISLIFIYLLIQLKHNSLQTKLNLISFAILTVALGLDFFYINQNLNNPFDLSPLLFFIFTVFQFFSLAAQQRFLQNTQKELVVNLKRLNDMCLKFVPKEFLNQIEKNSINKVELGDYAEKSMTISYTNLDFNSIWETELSSEQEYTLFSNCVSIMFPIIKKHNGYIAKMIGQDIICLFSKHPSDAVYCNLEISKELENYMNKENNESCSIKKSTGIHYGKVLLGTIGEKHRLEDTVISDGVNLVARLSDVAKKMNVDFIFSDDFYRIISENQFDFAQLGVTDIKGKSQPVTLYTCTNKTDNLEGVDYEK